MADQNQMQRMIRYASIGTEFILIFGLLLVGGVMLDRKLDSPPLYTLIGAVGGFALGLYRMISELRRLDRQSQKERQDRDRRGPD